jgi:hypothetical protein
LKLLRCDLPDAKKTKVPNEYKYPAEALFSGTFRKHLFIVSSKRFDGYVVVFTGDLTNLVTFIKNENVAVVK